MASIEQLGMFDAYTMLRVERRLRFRIGEVIDSGQTSFTFHTPAYRSMAIDHLAAWGVGWLNRARMRDAKELASVLAAWVKHAPSVV